MSTRLVTIGSVAPHVEIGAFPISLRSAFVRNPHLLLAFALSRGCRVEKPQALVSAEVHADASAGRDHPNDVAGRLEVHFVSRCDVCLRQTLQNLLNSSLSGVVRLFFVVE